MDHPPPFRRSRSLVASALKARSPRLRPVSPYLRVPYLSGVRRYTKWSDFCTPPPLSPSHSRNLSVLSSSFPSPSPSVRTSYKDGPKGTGCAYGRWSPWSVVNERARGRGGRGKDRVPHSKLRDRTRHDFHMRGEIWSCASRIFSSTFRR